MRSHSLRRQGFMHTGRVTAPKEVDDWQVPS